MSTKQWRMTGLSPTRTLNTIFAALVAAINRLDKSLDPAETVAKLRAYHFTWEDSIYILHAASALFWVYLWPLIWPFKIAIVLLYVSGLLVPLTSQFLLPATPVLSWVIMFFSSRFIPNDYRPDISVSLLPTLESVLYGSNISDILTRFTHPLLDILAWLPYGVIHFIGPAFVAAALWLFAPRKTLQFWARVFGWMNFTGVFIQIIFPCAPPCTSLAISRYYSHSSRFTT